MSMDNDPGFKVTVKDVYLEVQKILDRLPDEADARMRKLEAQTAAQWVVVSLVVVGVGGLIARVLTATIT